jgi:hypothetical protein
VLLIDEFASDHRDLRYRSAPGQESEPQEEPEDLGIRKLWRSRYLIRTFVHLHARAPKFDMVCNIERASPLQDPPPQKQVAHRA